MESTLRRHLGDGEQNCDWSVVYVFVAAVAAVLSAAGASWGLAVLCRRRRLASTSTNGFLMVALASILTEIASPSWLVID